MVLRYRVSDVRSIKEQLVEHTAENKETKTKRRGLTCLLLLANLIVANTCYNLWRAEKNTPIWKCFTANVVYELWTARKNTVTKHGVVAGTLWSADSSSALINNEIVREGDIVDGVKVVKIDKGMVEFEKNGERWTQRVLAKPNRAWKKQSTG